MKMINKIYDSGYNIASFAREIGVPYNTVYRFVTGRTRKLDYGLCRVMERASGLKLWDRLVREQVNKYDLRKIRRIL